MIELLSIYKILSIIELVIVLVFGVLMFVKQGKTNKVIMLINVCILFLINVFQLPMEIQMKKSYVSTIVLIIIWFVSIAYITFKLIKSKK